MLRGLVFSNCEDYIKFPVTDVLFIQEIIDLNVQSILVKLSQKKPLIVLITKNWIIQDLKLLLAYLLGFQPNYPLFINGYSEIINKPIAPWNYSLSIQFFCSRSSSELSPLSLPKGTLVQVMFPYYAAGMEGKVVGVEKRYGRYLINIESNLSEKMGKKVILSLYPSDFEVITIKDE